MNATSKLGFFVAVAMLAVDLATAGEETRENRGQLSAKDYKFASDAARGSKMEVQAGELAQTKSANPLVKKFGARMVADHVKTGKELADLATRKGAALPTDLDTTHQGKLAELQKLSGPEFDAAYARSMVEGHKKKLKDFQKAAEEADDPDLKAFASKNAKVVAEHLQQAMEMSASVTERASR